jgi:Trp operon repressor
MPRASKAELSKEQLVELFSDLTSLLSSFKKTGSLHRFLEELFTKEEKIMFSKRIAIYSMLFSKVPLRQIQQTLGMSDESVRIYNEKKHERSLDFQSVLKSLGSKKRRNQFIKKLEKKFKIVDDILDSRTDMKARARLMSGDFEDHPF